MTGAPPSETPSDDLPPVSITPAELSRRLAAGEPLVLVDVREGWEVEIASLPGSVHLPMGSLPARHGVLAREPETITVCHHGIRSLNSALFLRSVGIRKARSLHGGLDLWAQLVDPAMPRY